jgi:site-specific recombinase XerD
MTWLEEREVTGQVVEEFLYYLKTEQKLKNSSMNTYYAMLCSLRSYMMDRGLTGDFMKGFHTYKEEDVHIEPLTDEECGILLLASCRLKNRGIERNYRALTHFLLLTGSRFEDGQALKCQDVDITGKKVTYTQLKNRRIRHIYVPESLLTILKEQILRKRPQDLVFINSIGGKIHYPDYHTYLTQLAKAAGITKRVSAHILRHSYSQSFYDETGDIYLLKNVIGHKQITSTERYVRNSQKQIKTAQLLHPFLKQEIDPHIRVEKLKETIESQHLEQDERFDYMKVKELVADFLLNLHKSIKPVLTLLLLSQAVRLTINVYAYQISIL